jgi:probable F420-dependent oxidoreductase
MRVGIGCSGFGPGAEPEFIKTAAQTAERVGFATFWFGEHVVLFNRYTSKYPYSGKVGDDNSPIPDPTTALIDPVVAMTWAAAATSKIEVASGIIILPQRNPVVLAKELATLDALSGGRALVGVGVGWSREEYEAIGVAWEDRGKRMDEYVSAMRALWGESPSTFTGRTVSFQNAYLYPKPLRNRQIPIVFGGESDLSLQRVARCGDGWLAIAVPIETAPEKVGRLHQLVRQNGRDPAKLRIIQAIFSGTSLDDLKRYRDAGVTEFQLLVHGELPVDEKGLAASIEDLSTRFVATAAKL